MSHPVVAALLLAGDRGPNDPVAQATRAPCKALSKVAGRPMVLRVLDTLERSHGVGTAILCGPQREYLDTCGELTQRLRQGPLKWVAPRESPSLSAAAALDMVPKNQPILITTADHALLTPIIVEHFLQVANDTEADVLVGLVRYEQVQAAYPNNKRTVLRFRDVHCCTCNLFGLQTAAGRAVVPFWRQVEQERKSPLRMLGLLGPSIALRYRLGWLTLAQALDELGHRLNLKIKPVWMPFADAAVDVDSVEDLALVELRLRQ